MADYWGPVVSDETPPSTANQRHLINAFHCSGSYCDNLHLRNKQINDAEHKASGWSSWFSEEENNFYICNDETHGYLAGIACKDSYCDNLSLQCVIVSSKTKTECYWTKYFSEEEGQMKLKEGYYAVGIRCSGSYCDNKSIYACNAL
jgi:hypothetical protein